MKHLIFFTVAVTLFMPQASANEAFIQSLQTQMASMETAMKSMQTSIQAMQITIENQNEVIEQQNLRINGLEGKKTGTQPSSTVDSPVKVAGLSQGFNPDIGVVGTAQALLTEENEDEEGKDTVTLKELEISFSQYVDPYSRLDAIIALNDNLEAQNVDIEEAYYTHWGLPWGFVGTLGKFRTKVGKQNLQHLHQLDTVDYPAVIRDFFGEEGMSSSGFRLQNMIPNPLDIPFEVSAAVLRGNNGNSFSGISRRPIFNVHAKTFFEMNEDMNLELGGTWMNGDENIDVRPNGDNKFGVHVFGADATFEWFLPEERKLKLQGELYAQDRSGQVTANDHPWGFYTLLDFKFHPKFSAGIRYDYVEPLGVAGENISDTSISPYITFWQSEFANFRVQYTHSEPASIEDGESNDAIFLQANFLIGAHSHPVA